MFLDENGEKISKSKGNGLTLDEWLTYGREESLAFYIYREPKKAKSLHLGVIPRAVDEYWQFRGNYADQPIDQKLGNPVHHIHAGKVPEARAAADLRAAAQPRRPARLRRQGHCLGLRPALRAGRLARSHPELDALIGLAVDYARDFVAPTLQRRAPDGDEAAALRDLDARAGGAARRRRRRRASRTTSTRSASATRSKACATGSRRSTRPCSAPARARAWAASSRSTASTTAAG